MVDIQRPTSTKDEQTTEQTIAWAFHSDYKEQYGGLPPSQQREAVKRLTGRRRNPLTEAQCAELSSEVEGCLSAVKAAYLNKKARSKAASATKRMIHKSHPEPAEPEAEPEAEVEAVSDAVAALSVAEIVAEEPAPEPQPPAVKRSAPIAIPAPAKPLPVARAPAATPMPALALPPKPAAQKSGGLGAMLKR